MDEIVSSDGYGQDRTQTKRFLATEEERDGMPLYAKAGVAAVATAGLLALGHRSGAMRKVSKYLDVQGRATLQAARETLDEEGALFRNIGNGRTQKAGKRFLKKRKELITKQVEKQKNILSSRDFQMANKLKERSSFVGRIPMEGEKVQIKGVVPFHVEEGLRFNLVMKDLKKNNSSWLKDDKEIFEKIEKAIGRGNTGSMNATLTNYNEVRQLLHNQGITDKKYLDALDKTRKRYRGSITKANTMEILDVDNQRRTITTHGKDVLEEIMRKSNKITAEEIQTVTRKNGKIKEAIVGHKQATVADILELHKQKRYTLDDEILAKINDVKKHNKNFDKAIWDENLYIDKKGELFDYKSLSNVKDKTLDWYSGTLPGMLMKTGEILNVKQAREQTSFRMMKRQTVQPTLNGHMNREADRALEEDVMYVNGLAVKLFDSADEFSPLNNKRSTGEYKRFYLSTSRYGTMAKTQRSAAGIMTDPNDEKVTIFGNKKKRNRFEKALDLRGHDQESDTMDTLSILTKFTNPDWERNKVKSMLKDGVKEAEDFHNLKNYLNKYTDGFNQRLTHNLFDDFLPTVSLGESGKSLKTFMNDESINFSRDEDIVKVFEFLGKNRTNKPSNEFSNLFRKYENNPNEVLLSTSPIGENSILYGGSTRMQTGHDVIRQAVSLEIVDMMVKTRNVNNDSREVIINKLLEQTQNLHKEGKIWKKDLEQFDELMTNYLYRDAGAGVKAGEEGTMNKVNSLLTGDSDIDLAFQNNLRNIVKKNNPLHESFSSIKPINRVEDEFMLYNAAFDSTTLEGRAKEFFLNFGDMSKQLKPTTGRNNMEDFTALSMIGYYMPYRLQNALGQAGLGFSDDSMANGFDIWKNLFTKRFIPAAAGVSAYQYIDYELDEQTGSGISERYQNFKADRRLDEAEDRTPEEIAEAKRKRQLMPGAEQFDLFPSVTVPILGEIAPTRAIVKGTAGVLSGGMIAPSEEDTMSYEEVMDDLQYGTEEIRKGRWWAFGSKTSYAGDKVNYFAPNNFRLAQSDYEYTDTMYGDGENWENSWMPNFRNPLGALGYLVGTANPYWFEEKHYSDRPYMLTGELFNANTPLLGDVGNATIGKLIKPVKEMHEEYWEMGAEQAQAEADSYGQRPDGPIVLNVSPGGRKEMYVGADAGDFGAEYQGADQGQVIPLNEIEDSAENMTFEDYRTFLMDKGVSSSDKHFTSNYRYAVHSTSESPSEDGEAAVVTDLKTMKRIFIPGRLAGDYSGDYEKAFAAAEEKQELEAENSEIERQNAFNEIYKMNPRSMTEPEYAYRTEMDKQKLKQIIDPRSTGWRMQELQANWSEPQGVYNWIIGDELMGNDPYAGKTIIQRADAANNMSESFWQGELGSIGGQISEIGRRFIRRDSGQLDTYNPIRNEMPDWMPGGNYFINFQTGDPYQKIDNGEYRLPGEAYESLNQLHPDETGEYGAFDKFKILADVAPWSDEYKFWRDYAVKNIEDPEVRKQIQIIKKQVAKRNVKREFHEYIFKDADIVKQDVTIKRFLDDYTFLTEEFGDTPIRLGGVDVRASSDGAIHHYLKEGDKVQVGIDANPNDRISNDTYGTMKAVVYKNLENINQELIFRGMVKELEGDDSPVGVHARFTDKEIRQGSRWESVAHYDSALNTKFLKVRTATEDYERDQVYGKAWATWENFGITDYLIPAIDEMRGELGPKGLVEASLSGTFVGAFIGRIILGGGKKKMWGSSAIGGAIGLSSNAFAQMHYKNTGERYLPERRIQENEINEYFDFLEYLKNTNLYEQSRMELAHQGIDLDAILYDMDEQTEQNKEQKKMLEAEKKRLYLEQPEDWKEQQKEINQQLKLIEESSTSFVISPEIAEAIQYKENAESTLYAINPYGDRLKLQQAMPYKDREYFNAFVEATPEEQERLLTILPENQKRIYKALWGYGLDEQKPIEYYIEKYNIPAPDWEGWSPEYNLEDTKVQVVQKKGLDLSDFNFWSDDVQASQFVPPINEDMEYQNKGRVSNEEIERNIRSVLSGQGYTGVSVSVMNSNSSNSNVTFDYTRDRQSEIEYELQYNMDQYI